MNLSRSTLTDEGALRGAALDLPHTEPICDDHPFLNVEEALLTPHTASGAVECWNLMSAAPVQGTIDGECEPSMVIDDEVLTG